MSEKILLHDVKSGPYQCTLEEGDLILHFSNGADVRLFDCPLHLLKDLEGSFDSYTRLQCQLYCSDIKKRGNVGETLFPDISPCYETVIQYCQNCGEERSHTVRKGEVSWNETDCKSLKLRCQKCDSREHQEIYTCNECGLSTVVRIEQTDSDNGSKHVCWRCGLPAVHRKIKNMK